MATLLIIEIKTPANAGVFICGAGVYLTLARDGISKRLRSERL